METRAARVLVVDDEPGIVEVMELLLSEDGYEVLRARSSDECIRLARARRPEVILLDVQMPGRDGYATAAVLSQDEATRSIPIVMVTGLIPGTVTG